MNNETREFLKGCVLPIVVALVSGGVVVGLSYALIWYLS